jgi:hypothetical protein
MTTRTIAVAAAFAFAACAQADLVIFTANLDGPSEAPPNASPGIGFAQIDWDTTAHTMRVQASFSGLLGTTTAAHIHASTAAPFAGTAGVATQTPSFSSFPLGVTAGAMDQTFDLTQASSFSAAFLAANGGTPAGAEAALFSAASSGRAYFNIHSTVFGAGEIRGFLVPVPGSAIVLAAGGLLAARRRRT